MAVFLQRLQVVNYRSIARASVDFDNLTLLVGPNGAGKSNLLDSIHFVSDALSTTLAHALRDRGGINDVRRHSRGHPTHFGIALELDLGESRGATYSFRVSAERNGGFSVQHEHCVVKPFMTGENGHVFCYERGKLKQGPSNARSDLEQDRLALTTLSALPEFRPVYDGLTRMGFYNLNPERIRELQEPDPGQIMARDGRNLAAVLRELVRGDAKTHAQICEYLQAIVPGVTEAYAKTIGPKETIEFRQEVGDKHPWRFLAASMSDGTLRVLGVLLAVFQASSLLPSKATLIGLEEPETAIHPGAAEILTEALISASERVQVIVSTHSPDLLDHKALTANQIRAVVARNGETVVAPIDEASRSALRDGLYSAGELFRLGQIEPDEGSLRSADQLDLFDH